MNKRTLVIFALAVGVLLLATMEQAFATAILDDLASGYKSRTAVWSGKLFGYAKRLFLALATIQIIWATLWWIIDGNSPGKMLASFLRTIMGLMFFYAILLNFDTWIPAIIDGFSAAGASATGVQLLTPSTVFDRGLELSSKLLSVLSEMGLLEASINKFLLGALCALGILLSFTIIAGQMLVTLLESYICVSGGVIFLGFAGSSWTSSFTSKYLTYCVSVGVKLFFTYLIVGAGTTLTDSWITMMKGTMAVSQYLEVLAGSLIYAILAWQIPSVAGSALSGTVSMSLNNAASSAASMASGAMAVAGGPAGKAAAAGMAVASNAAGAVGVGKQAVEAANNSGATSVLAKSRAALGAVGGGVSSAAMERIKGLGSGSAANRLSKRMEARNAEKKSNSGGSKV